jgi:hypothetical protein
MQYIHHLKWTTTLMKQLHSHVWMDMNLTTVVLYWRAPITQHGATSLLTVNVCKLLYFQSDRVLKMINSWTIVITWVLPFEINARENQRSNPECTIQRNCQHWTYKTQAKANKQANKNRSIKKKPHTHNQKLGTNPGAREE